MEVIPNTIVGIGSTSPLSLSFNAEHQKLLVNKVGFNSTGINTTTSSITINDHGYKTGDKVLYESNDPAEGLDNPCYYVYELSSNEFSLGETLKDVQVQPPLLVGINSTGGQNHSFGLVNPQIKVVKNSKISFNISDSSLLDYNLKFFYDKEFNNDFISAQDTSVFNISGFGTSGIGTQSTVTLSFSETTPSQLYYAIEKGGYISTADPLVPNYSEIKFVDSKYSGNYSIFGITSDTFKVSPRSIPELLSYKEDQCEKLEYSTESRRITGSIKDVKVISKGLNYKSIPKFKSVVSAQGKNANIVALSTSIGRINDVRIVDIGYEYPSDKTKLSTSLHKTITRVNC